MTALALFASRGPFGPTYLTCILLPLFLLGPLIVLAICARSLLSNDPVPRWLLAVAVLGSAGGGFMVWQEGFARNVRGMWVAWQCAAVTSAVLTPPVVVVEGLKRGWVRRPW